MINSDVKLVLVILLTLVYSTVTDIDGNVYETIQIGNQLWIKENLKVTKYNNGDYIPNINSSYEWDNCDDGFIGAFSYYDNFSNECIEYDGTSECHETFGKIYNWYAVFDERGICPEGWHVPSSDEWEILTNIISFEGIESWGNNIAGGKMKSLGTIENSDGLWRSPNTGATNEVGFTALPGGKRNDGGNFDPLGEWAFFWTDEFSSSNQAIAAYINYNDAGITIASRPMKEGLSIRCTSNSNNYESGCIDINACNYNPNASIDNDSCEYPAQNYDCNGNFLGCNEYEYLCNSNHNLNQDYCISIYQVCDGIIDCQDTSDEENCLDNGCRIEFDDDDDGICNWNDADSYQVIQIGNQVWMKENLKVRNYQNGDKIEFIPNVIAGNPDDEWGSLSGGAFAHYDNDPSIAEIYGNIYNGYTVNDERGVCPEGWHVPSEEEIETLHWTISPNPFLGVGQGGENAVTGGMLKDIGTIESNDGLWHSPNTGATNEFGFTALPSGGIGQYGGFYGLGNYGKYWTSTQSGSTTGGTATRTYTLWNDFGGISITGNDNNIGKSIRCLVNGSDYGCMDPTACNYNSEAIVSGNCDYAQENYDCSGNIICELGYTYIDGNSYCQDDLQVLQDLIDLNSLNSNSSVLDDYDNDAYNDNQDSLFEPLEFGHQVWNNGRLTSLSSLSGGIYESFGYVIEYLPNSIYMLDDLQYLCISETGLIEFPETIGDLPNLLSLDVWRNNLTDDSFPQSMNNLDKLSGLSLDGNELTVIPDFIQHTANTISFIYLGYNFWGTGNQIKYFPDWWSNTAFANLGILDLSNNYLKELPRSFFVATDGYWGGLNSLTLWNNHLTSIDDIDWLCAYADYGTQIYLQDNYICEETLECIDDSIIGNQKGCDLLIDVIPPDFEFNSSITAAIYLDEQLIGNENDKLAVFSNGEIRGVASTNLIPELGGAYDNQYLSLLMLYSNNMTGDIMEFQYYDSFSNRVYSINETYIFSNDDIVGNAILPHILTLNVEIDVDHSYWIAPDEGSLLLDMGWGVYHSIIIDNDALSFLEDGDDLIILDHNGGINCYNNGEVQLNQITYNSILDTTYTINVSQFINYCNLDGNGGSLTGFIPGNTIYYKVKHHQEEYYIEPNDFIGENIFNSEYTIINSFLTNSLSNNFSDNNFIHINDNLNTRSTNDSIEYRNQNSYYYEIVRNEDIILDNFTESFYLDKNIQNDEEYCYYIKIKDINGTLISTTDIDCITITNENQTVIGDVNQDTVVNVSDIVMVVEWILSDIENDLGDVNNDGVVNVSDIVMLVELILNP